MKITVEIGQLVPIAIVLVCMLLAILAKRKRLRQRIPIHEVVANP